MSNREARLCGYWCSFTESITTWPQSKMAASFVRKNGSLVARASIYLLFSWGPGNTSIRPAMLVFPGHPTSPCLLGRDPPALRLAARIMMPCQFSKSSYSLTPLHLYRFKAVCILYLHPPRLVPSCPYYYCRRSCSLSSSYFLTVHFANTDVAWLLMRFMDFKWHSLLCFLYFRPTVSFFWLEQSMKHKINLAWPNDP